MSFFSKSGVDGHTLDDSTSVDPGNGINGYAPDSGNNINGYAPDNTSIADFYGFVPYDYQSNITDSLSINASQVRWTNNSFSYNGLPNNSSITQMSVGIVIDSSKIHVPTPDGGKDIDLEELADLFEYMKKFKAIFDQAKTNPVVRDELEKLATYARLCEGPEED